MISVVTIVKDDLHGFLRTRHSLEEQTFHQWEHIIVPASSGDLTGLLAGELSLGRTVYHVQDGSGIYSAMNQGLALATQDFVVFLNAGDMLAGAETFTFVSSALTSATVLQLVVRSAVGPFDTRQERPTQGPWSSESDS